MQSVPVTFFLALTLCTSLLAQTDTSLFKSPDSTKFFSFYSSFDTIRNISPEVFFRQSLNYWLYDVVPIYRDAAFNGNIASYRYDFTQQMFFSDTVFNIVPFFSHLLLKKNTFKSTVTHHPATAAIYTWGLKKEQTFHVYHTQRLSRQFAVNLYYNLLSAPGIYQRQRTNQQHFWSQFVWLQKNHRAIISGGLTHNSILQNENGGIKNLEDFTDTSLISREFVPVNILQAERKIRQNQWYLDQHYRIFSDSTLLPLVVTLQSGFSPTTQIFSDLAPDVTFYSIVFDTTSTYDSSRHQSYWQKVAFSNLLPFEQQMSQTPVQFIIGASFNLDKINQDTTSAQFRWFEFFSKCSIKFPYQTNVFFDIKYRSGEYVDGNYLIGVRIKKNLKKILQSVSFSYNFDKVAPLYVFSYLRTNHSYWNNRFPLQQRHHFVLNTSSRIISLSVGSMFLDNSVFLNKYGVPELYNDIITLHQIQANIKGDFKHVSGTAKFTYQSSSQTDVISVPEFFVQPQIGVSWQMFDGVLHCFAGTEFFWFSSFYIPRWMVAQGLFAQQDSMRIGNFVYPSVFFAARLKRVRFFAHLDNVTAGLLPFRYFAMPDYPRFDRFFRWGLSWTFYN